VVEKCSHFSPTGRADSGKGRCSHFAMRSEQDWGCGWLKYLRDRRGGSCCYLSQQRGSPTNGVLLSSTEMGSVSEVIAGPLGVTGPQYTVSTACSSSAKVFRAGIDLLTSGLCDGVITGGVDTLCQLTLRGSSALELVSERITNPFSKNRDGITIGEGGALFLLERWDASSIDSSLVRVYGVGESSDAYHISSPDPSGEGARAAITMACGW
jgi:3-oxoacyl-[acyl-carrier-protein] synthase-1